MAPIINVYSGINLGYLWMADIDVYETVIFHRKWQDIGGFEIYLPLKEEYLDFFAVGRCIVLDNDPSRSGIIQFCEKSEADPDQIVVKGYTLNGLISKRINLQFDDEQMNEWNMGDDVVPASTGPGQFSTLPAEDVIKEYINRHIVNPTDAKRKMPFISVGSNLHRGTNLLKRAKNGTPLNQTLNEICIYADLGYEIQFGAVPTGAHKFDIIVGRDFGINPSTPNIEFSQDFDNIKELKFVQDETEYKNTGYAAGKRNANGSRAIAVVSSESVLPSAENRNEIFFDCGENMISVETNTELSLYDEGRQRIKQYAAVQTLDGETLDVGLFRYREDYDIGDIVSVKSVKFGFTEDKRISEVIETYDKDSPEGNIKIIFGTPKANLRNTIKKIVREAQN